MRHPWKIAGSLLALLAGCRSRAAEHERALSTPDHGHSQLTALHSSCDDPAPDGPGVIFASPYTTGRSALYKRNFQSPAPILLAGADADLRMPAPSPDGRTLAFVSNTRGKWDLFQVSLPHTEVARWTLVAGSDEDEATPAWSPDGEQLAWSALDRRDGVWRMRIRARDGSVREVGEGLAPAWHPDGTRLVCQRSRAGSGVWSLVVVDLATGASRDLLPTPEAGGITPAWTREADGCSTRGSCRARTGRNRNRGTSGRSAPTAPGTRG